jgi:ATP-binding cassette subfamily B protein
VARGFAVPGNKRPVAEVLASGGRPLMLSIGANIFLGMWPAAELLLIQRVVNAVASDHRGLATIAFLFGIGLFVTAVFIWQPIAAQRSKHHLYAGLMERFLRVAGDAPPEVYLDPLAKERMANAEDSIITLERRLLDDGVLLVQLGAATLALGILLGTIVWWAPLVLVVAVLTQMWVAQQSGRRLESQLADTAESRRLMDRWSEILSTPASARDVRSPGVLSWALSHWERAYRQASAVDLHAKSRSVPLQTLGNVIAGGSILLVLLAGLDELRRHQVGVGAVAILLIAALYLDQFVRMVLLQGQQWMGRRRFLIQAGESLASSVAAPVSPPAPASAVVLRGVRYTYPRAPQPALAEVSLEIRPGTKLAVVGPNGSGKTTLGKVLLGLLTPTAGHISRVTPAGACFQDFGRYQLSVRENVILGDIAYEEDTEGVLRVVGDLAPFVERLPQGIQTPLGPAWGGLNLSEGQWQALAVARGLFRSLHVGSGLVVLDEPTAALDPDRELALLETTMRLLRPFAVVFVVHRLVGCVFADEVLVLDAGRVAGYGPHQDLLQTCPLYRSMWEASSAFLVPSASVEPVEQEDRGGPWTVDGGDTPSA